VFTVTVSAVIVPLALKFAYCADPLTTISPPTSKSAFGNTTLPVPAASNSKSLFDSVVCILLPAILIFSNCVLPLTVRPSSTVRSALIVILPRAFKSPVIFKSLFTVTVLLNVAVSFAVNVPVISTLLLGTVTDPVPDATSSKSLSLSCVDILLPSNCRCQNC
jgi:hypothetical protein